ncbi:hypothetical protein EG68_05736 [Paragonimus skrjabini miyazakii]|uniref:Uncharacterized protein n=1 Tax=Paragonimus skrjabini miyazakii TaxID=59628 RepID=A0A8S9YR64_9TREM|nr:hypothetical protein EG68_05736 [Paragonimus skrjabini miyazakii]
MESGSASYDRKSSISFSRELSQLNDTQLAEFDLLDGTTSGDIAEATVDYPDKLLARESPDPSTATRLSNTRESVHSQRAQQQTVNGYVTKTESRDTTPSGLPQSYDVPSHQPAMLLPALPIPRSRLKPVVAVPKPKRTKMIYSRTIAIAENQVHILGKHMDVQGEMQTTTSRTVLPPLRQVKQKAVTKQQGKLKGAVAKNLGRSEEVFQKSFKSGPSRPSTKRKSSALLEIKIDIADDLKFTERLQSPASSGGSSHSTLRTNFPLITDRSLVGQPMDTGEGETQLEEESRGKSRGNR